MNVMLHYLLPVTKKVALKRLGRTRFTNISAGASNINLVIHRSSSFKRFVFAQLSRCYLLELTLNYLIDAQLGSSDRLFSKLMLLVKVDLGRERGRQEAFLA